jgi:hypothetical protein
MEVATTKWDFEKKKKKTNKNYAETTNVLQNTKST